MFIAISRKFFSVQNKIYMRLENHEFTLSKYTNKKNTITNSLNLKAIFYDRILIIKPYPVHNYSHFNFEGVNAVLHDLYHSGTACTLNTWGYKLFITRIYKTLYINGYKNIFNASCEKLMIHIKVLEY
jgi:hypothetical protein